MALPRSRPEGLSLVPAVGLLHLPLELPAERINKRDIPSERTNLKRGSSLAQLSSRFFIEREQRLCPI